MKRHWGKHGRYFFKVALMREKNQDRSKTSNYCVSQKKSTD